MDLINILVLASFLVNLFLGSFIHFRSQKNIANFIFEMAAFAIAFWCITMFSFRQVDIASSVLFAKILYFAASFTSPLFLLFGLYFVQKKVPEWLVWIIITYTGLVAILSLYPEAIIKNVIFIPHQEKTIIFGWAYPLYFFHILGFFSAFYGIFFYKYFKIRKTTLPIKTQIQYVLVGTSLISFVAMFTNLILPSVGYFSLNWAGQVLASVWVGFITYAIVKQRWLDIRLIVARAIAYSLVLLLFTGFYSLSLFVVGTYILPFKYSSGQLLLSVFLALVLAFSFQPLRRMLEKTTDRIFFRDRYDSHELLADLSKIMAQTLRLSDLTQCTLEKLLTEIRILKGAFILTHDGKIFDQKTIGFKPEPTFKEEDMKLLMTTGEVLFFETLEENDKVKEWMRKHELTVIIPLQTKEEKIGFLLLGDKASGDIYSSEDLKVLEIVSPELTIAIQNAEAYEEIRRFNITLKEEVEKATSDLQAANLKLKELDKLKDDFVSVASHELRTPMTAIRSYVWLALYKPDAPLTEKQKKYLDRTLKSTERLISLVNDMLNVSRIEAGRIEIDPKPFNILDLANEVMEEVASKAGEKTIRLIVENKQLPLLFGDLNKMHQVLLNLVGNSLKFTPVNGTIYITFETKGQFAQISVHDTGTGISKEDLEKLFNKFGRLDNSYTAIGTSGGTGLGLFISKSLIELMHGRIGAFSEGVGKGSTFAFTLPIATPEIIQQAEKYRIKPEGEIKNLEPVAI